MKKGTLFTTIGGIIVLVISFIAFVLPSSLGAGANAKVLSFGEYNGRKINYEQGSDFLDHISQISSNYQMYGYDPNQYNYQIFNDAFKATVKQYASEDALKASGYQLPEESVNRFIRSLPQFQENGKFSSKLYLKADKKAIEDLKKEVRKYLYTSRYEDDFYGSSDLFGETSLYGLKLSSAEAAFIQAYNEEKRGFDMVSFDKSKYPEDEKLKYAEQNAAKFNKFDLAVITCDDKTLADTVINRINKNEVTFEDAITEYSTNKLSNTEGVLTNNFQYQIETVLTNKEDLAVVSDLPVGSISSVLETSNGFAIFKKNSENIAPDFADEDLMSKVSSYILSYESTIIEDYFTALAKDFKLAVESTDFDSACTKFDVTKAVIEPFPLNYGNVAIAGQLNTSLEGLSGADQNENFLKTAFGLKMNECSEPIVMNRSIVVIQYTNSTEEVADEEDVGIVKSQLGTLDSNSADSLILSDSKLKNKFADTYFNEMMQ